jgi:predicted secreted protein
LAVTVNRDKTDADTTDSDSAGWAEHLVAQRGVTVDMEGQRKIDRGTGVADAGQAAINASLVQFGEDAFRTYRVQHIPSLTGIQFKATASTNLAGGLNDKRSLALKLTASGVVTAI